jgi:hypothetical protein
MYYYDPGLGFGQHLDWPLVNTTAIQSGQWTLDSAACYMMDDQANLFAFDDNARSMQPLGRVPANAAASWPLAGCLHLLRSLESYSGHLHGRPV